MTESDENTLGETWASYHFGDASQLTWGTYRDTGAENSPTHAVGSHAYINAFHTTDDGDEYHIFDSGDFDHDVTALLAKITELAAKHNGPSSNPTAARLTVPPRYPLDRAPGLPAHRTATRQGRLLAVRSKDTTSMFTTLLRSVLARLTPPMRTEVYRCDRCGLRAWITNHPDRIPPLLAAVSSHSCKPKPKTL